MMKWSFIFLLDKLVLSTYLTQHLNLPQFTMLQAVNLVKEGYKYILVKKKYSIFLELFISIIKELEATLL